jgi:hypothetical protein
MRLNFMVFGSLLLGSSLALADGAAPLPPLDAGSIPSQCQAVASVPPDAKIATPGLAARVALATCGATARFSALKLTPDDAGMKALSDAAKPSFDLLDEVMKSGDPTWTAMAQKAKADLNVGMAVRMRNSIPAITMQTVGAPLQEHDQAHAALEPKIKPWIDAGH